MVSGIPFPTLPLSLPITESQPMRPECSYALSKMMGETMADQFARWDSEVKVITLRFSHVMAGGSDYAEFLDERYQADPSRGMWKLWR